MNPSSNHLSVGEVAQHLGWSPRFIDSLVRSERLPGTTIHGELRFERNELIAWLEDKLMTLSHNEVVAWDNQLAARDSDQREPDPVTLQLSKSGIRWDLPATDPQDVLAKLADFAAESGAVTDRAALLASLTERERLCSTALPGGVAICHPRSAQPDIIWKPFIRLVRTAAPIAFGADDLNPTRLFFLLGATTASGHLQTLARLARILDDATKAALLAAKSAEAAYQLIASRDVTIQRKRQAWLAQNPDLHLLGDGI